VLNVEGKPVSSNRPTRSSRKRKNVLFQRTSAGEKPAAKKPPTGKREIRDRDIKPSEWQTDDAKGKLLLTLEGCKSKAPHHDASRRCPYPWITRKMYESRVHQSPKDGRKPTRLLKTER